MNESPDVRVGPAGWSYADWIGPVYPKPRPRGFHELDWIARYFEAAEINTSFYRPLEPKMSSAWVRRIRLHPRFLFTAKLWRRFTHEPEPPTPADAEIVRRGLAPLRDAGKLGAVLVQVPWSFRDTPASRARIELIRNFFPDLPLVFEPRHAEWGAPGALEFVRRLGFSFCNIDQPASRSSLPPTEHVFGPVGYVRLHGRNSSAWFQPRADRMDRYNYLYTPEELQTWVQRIRRMADKASVLRTRRVFEEPKEIRRDGPEPTRPLERAKGTPVIFVITNNHVRGQGVVNALQLRSLLAGEKVPAPEPLREHYPSLIPFTRSGGNLFPPA